MGKTLIEWTDRTWNPVRGCSRVSEGCRNCYAERQAARFAGPNASSTQFQTSRPFAGFVHIVNGHPQWTGKVELIEKHLTDPLHWKKPQRVFVNSMSDLFHEALPDEAIDRVFAVMALCPQHTFQVLTKRPERMLSYLATQFRIGDIQVHATALGDPWMASQAMRNEEQIQTTDRWPLPNVWLGVSCEDQKTADERIPLLLQTPAAVRFVSYEPALGPVDFHTLPNPSHPGWQFSGLAGVVGSIPGLDWVIVGGESGPGARPFDIAWARNTIAQCKAAGVACFVKQLGADPREGDANGNCRNVKCTHPDCGYIKLKLNDRKGGDMSEWPKYLRVREFPNIQEQR